MRLRRLAHLLLTVAAVASSGESLPVEDISPGLRGTDADFNGIRDDIDQLISMRYADIPD